MNRLFFFYLTGLFRTKPIDYLDNAVTKYSEIIGGLIAVVYTQIFIVNGLCH